LNKLRIVRSTIFFPNWVITLWRRINVLMWLSCFLAGWHDC
jgi:hypothetical protein